MNREIDTPVVYGSPQPFSPVQETEERVEDILGFDYEMFAKKCLPASVPDNYKKVIHRKYISVPFNPTHAQSGSFGESTQTNLIQASDGSLWVLVYEYLEESKDALSTIPGSRLIAVDEYWDRNNSIYPVSRVFRGYENPL